MLEAQFCLDTQVQLEDEMFPAFLHQAKKTNGFKPQYCVAFFIAVTVGNFYILCYLSVIYEFDRSVSLIDE